MSSDSPEPTTAIDQVIDRLRTGDRTTRRSILRRSAAAGAGALALTVAGSNAALAEQAARDETGDVDVLNYALTLEHLENAFYRDGLERFDRTDFMRSETLQRFGNAVREEARPHIVDVGDHEATHVTALTDVIESLGGKPVGEACYDFGVENVDEFLAVAAVLENTGVSAYDGAVDRFENDALLTAGATIATVEARHASYLNLLTGADPFPAAFDTAKSQSEILEAAGGFIVECE